MNTQKRRKPIVIKDDCLFDLLILIFFLVLALMSLRYNPTARSIPLVLAIVGAVMMFLQFLADALPAARVKLRFVTQRGLLKSISLERKPQAVSESEAGFDVTQVLRSEFQEKERKIVSWIRVLRVVFWLVCFIIVLKYIGYLVAVGFFLFFLTKLEAKESWARSICLAVGTCIAFYVLFEVILKARL
jgi:hypothetical protein